MLKLYNSLSKKKEVFSSLESKKATVYVCGITPYDTTHLGHAFTYISFDILIRLLRFKKYEVTYTQNVTDINDRDKDILKRAKEQNISWQNLAKFWTKKFLYDMKALNWVMPDSYVKASENIDPMISMIKKLLKNGFAYEKNGSVYFDISKDSDFGKLSRSSREKMLKISKEFDEDIENPNKNDPLDFTLWRGKSKNEPSHIPSYDSPFGQGRPGWHIECSAMSTVTLGSQIDIHGGGIDLIYPHHEAEIAQSEGATLKKPFAKYWLHTAPVSYLGAKMSKSLGNLVMVSDLLKKYSAKSIRWYLISHHYREPFEFFEKDLKKSNEEFFKIETYLRLHHKDIQLNNNDILSKGFMDALEDDLNTPKALKIIQNMVKQRYSQKIIKKYLDLLGF